MRSAIAAPILAATLLLGGCTAILSTVRVVEAQRAVRTAREKDAAAKAPYEYTMAIEHLDKAIEESGDAQHRRAVQLAKASRGWAQAAVIQIEGSGAGRTIANPEEDLQDVSVQPVDRSAPPPPPPPPRETDDIDDFLDDDADEDDATWETTP